jgi:DNA polymerase-3 subunit delta
MAESAALVYILDGEDEFEIARFIAERQARLGDPTTAEMNTTRLDGHSANLEAITGAVRAMPFLAPRRLVLLTHPLAQIKTEDQRKKFKALLEAVPATAELLLVEDHLLTDERKRKKGEMHWLEKWAAQQGGRVEVHHCAVPTGEAMVQWIMARAKARGGQFTPPAASSLAGLVGDDPRLAGQEIDKLLAYVNYTRPVEPDDVESLTTLSARVPDFALANALRGRNARQAQSILHRMLAEDDPIPLLHSIAYQFRILLLARELIERRGQEEDLVNQMKVHPYVARLAFEQARRFSLADLEAIYHSLLDVDEAMKTGQMPGDLALELLVTRLTS